MRHHPYTEIWPLIDGEDFERLKADILANGLLMPVLTYRNQVLDGRNRERACEAVGVLVRYQPAPVKSDADALKLVVSLNDQRRHLTPEQRAFAAARLANLANGSNQHKNTVGVSGETPTSFKLGSVPFSREEAAKMLHVSLPALNRARSIMHNGNSDDVADVLSGRIKLAVKADQLRDAKKAGLIPKLPDKPRLVGPAAVKVVPNPTALNFATFTGTIAEWRRLVDPEFTGTPTEFTDKYGHVQSMTAEGYATMRFGDLATAMRALAMRVRELPERRKADPNWLRSPKERDIIRLTEALNVLRPLFAEAEEMLAVATSSMPSKAEAAE
jgi:hypothetical protein